jgi:hypothetical protein
MGERPSPLHTIDRIDPDGDYEPDNCRWATRADQTRNTRSTRNLEFNGVTKCMADWARDFGVWPGTIARRLKRQTFPEIAAVFLGRSASASSAKHKE